VTVNDDQVENQNLRSISLTTKNNLYKPKVKTYAKCVKDWANYINGSTNRPKKPLSSLKKDQSISGRTLISKNHSEGAANKPIVNCRVGKNRCPVLFDTGAEINVIDQGLLEKLRSENSSIKFIPANGFLNCANGSKLKILGYAGLRVSVGVQHLPLKFTVVSDLFPKMIVGLPSMKKYSVDVMPSHDAIRVCGVEIPFISKTIVSENY